MIAMWLRPFEIIPSHSTNATKFQTKGRITMWLFITKNKHNRKLRLAELNIIERLEPRLKKIPGVLDNVVELFGLAERPWSTNLRGLSPPPSQSSSPKGGEFLVWVREVGALWGGLGR